MSPGSSSVRIYIKSFGFVRQTSPKRTLEVIIFAAFTHLAFLGLRPSNWGSALAFSELICSFTLPML